jgi:predicted nucleic-acid-binding protein
MPKKKITIDTSALIRFFTNDESGKADKVRRLLETSEHIFIPEVVFPELEYVLTGTYDVTRSELVTIFEFLITTVSIVVEPSTKQAVELYKKSELDIADCITAAHAQNNQIATFDAELAKISKANPVF